MASSFPGRAARVAGLALLAGCVSQTTIERFKAKHREFRTRATYLPPVSLTGTWLPEGRIHNEQGELGFSQVLLDATVPIPRDDDSFWIVGALAGVRQVDFDGVPALADDDLHRYGLRLGYGRFFSDDFVVTGYWQPSVYSDLDGTLNSADYRLYYGSVLAVYRTTPSWFWKAGFSGNDAADTCIIPHGGFAWHFGERWSLQVLVPRDATLVFEDGPWMVTTGFLIESDEYHVRSPEALDLEQDVHVQELQAHLTVERSLFHDVSFLVRGGSIIDGDWDWSYGDGGEALTGALEPDLFLAVGINYRF